MHKKRHGSPVPSRGPLVPMKPKTPAVAPAVNPSPGDTLAFRVPKDYPHSRFNKAPLAVYPPKGARSKTCVSLPVVSLEKMPCLSRTSSGSHMRLNSAPSVHKPSSLTPPPSQRSSEKLLNGRVSSGPPTPRASPSPSSVDGRPSPVRSPLDRRPSSTPSPSQSDRKPSPSPSPSQRCSALPSSSSSTLERKQQNGTKTTAARPHKRLSGRVFDPNKHCGVPDPETKRPCTRSLTCKSHSLTQRRAVQGRRKHFDVLLAEHKSNAKEKEGLKEREKERERERDVAQERKEQSLNKSLSSHQSPSKAHCPNGRPLSTLKLRLANAHIPRAPGPTASSSSSSTPLPPAPTPPSAPHPEPSPSGWTSSAGEGGRLSSDEGDAESPEDTDRAALHFSSHHPQPLGLCIFNSRLMGRGHYVFDRRWDRMRLALQNMVEKHLNSQMWRKVPLAAESLQTPSSSSSSSSSQQPYPPSPLSGSSPVSTPPSNSYTSTFPQTTGVFNIRDAPLSHSQTALGKAGNGTHKSSRQSKVTEDSLVGSKKRKNSTFYSFSSLFPAVDNHKRNGSSHHPTLQGAGGTVATPARRKELGGGGGGLWSGAEGWMSRSEGPHNSQSSRDAGVSAPYTSTKDAATAPYQPLPSPSVPLAHGGKAENRKRRSPSSFRGKPSKLSRPGEPESVFGKGNDNSGILALRPESPRQVKMHH
ncbi:ataxin-7-like protein 1 isoform X2 [Boleophthalmus pectinirostris]|uniref:ataxin-7-like protein 1 isoform X2 n=1 Tax=Boleophthalmus pectinirostris TaxID=150288 RepID=UPI00242CA8EF|nr:ataxin-7-like protein 1 isoform X2 [Boleophthalmus pectinirostris]XP_055009634.1 ataxin-7-like protein 1 isoform X2 [Boleophthalmus pectinirostris]